MTCVLAEVVRRLLGSDHFSLSLSHPALLSQSSKPLRAGVRGSGGRRVTSLLSSPQHSPSPFVRSRLLSLSVHAASSKKPSLEAPAAGLPGASQGSELPSPSGSIVIWGCFSRRAGARSPARAPGSLGLHQGKVKG